jgi:hypothetical protein
MRQHPIFKGVKSCYALSQDSKALPISLDLETSDLGEMTALRARCAILLVEVKVSCSAILHAFLCQKSNQY